MANDPLKLDTSKVTEASLTSGMLVNLVAPDGFDATATWKRNGAPATADDLSGVQCKPGQSITFDVTNAAGDQTAKAILRWKPNAPTNVEVRSAGGALEVSWNKVSDENRTSYYEVNLTPAPTTAQLPRRTTGQPLGRPIRRHIQLRALPNDFYGATVTAVASYTGADAALVRSDEGKSNPDNPAESPGLRSTTFRTPVQVSLAAAGLVAFVGGVALLLSGPLGRGDDEEGGVVLLHWWAVFIGVLVVAGAISVLSAIRRPRDLLGGADGRISTSKVNVAMWTITVGFALATLTSMELGAHRYGVERENPCVAADEQDEDGEETGDVDDGGTIADDEASEAKRICTDPDRQESRGVDELGIGTTFHEGLTANYLLLLGAPFAGLAGAKAIVNRQVRQGSQRVSTGRGRFTEALTDDNGDADLADSQYLLFTVVLLFYFYAVFLSSPFALPDLPWGLVGLTGISAATYLLNKQVSENGLSIDALVPSTAPADAHTKIRVLGRNFTPAGSTDLPNAGVSVVVGSTGVEPESVSDTEIVFTTPSLGGGAYEVVVTTAANVAASAGDLTVTSP